ncbi:MAG: type II toxin-antitoxin system death-on-curing family toxin [Deltaproteobacteria bacterium]|nr:type II toxin-antitoxin system death-on-curing family toxin [Deltaproteobacteria bacterium]
MRWLSRRLVETLHAQVVDLFGGLQGLRDAGLLESALAQPQASFGGVPLHRDVWEMAAAYGYHLCRNHAFLDGNKRIAAVAMITFLRANGQAVRYDEVQLYLTVMDLAAGRLDKAQLAAWLRERALPR